MKFYFIRHGESVANVLRVFSNNEAQHPLTEVGYAQARSLAQSLTGCRAEKVYSSPVLRAVQTAQIVADHLQLPLEIHEALREWSVGIFEGTDDPAGWELHRKVQEDWYFHNKLYSKMPGGESFLEIRERFLPFIESLIRENQQVDQELILVAHGGLYLAMLPSLLQNVDYAFALEHSISNTACIEAEVRTEGLYCTSWCGIPPG